MIRQLVRKNILKLEPYRCARDDFSEGILLDANENTTGPTVHDISVAESELELNRYPDPHQIELKSKFCEFRGHGLKPENLYLGVGSDEAIDSLIRVFCRPGDEKILTCPPTYGMYSVSAEINDVEVVKVPLDFNTFELQPDLVVKALNADPKIKLVYICSPGNPTAKRVNPDLVLEVLKNWENGVVVVDEAYIDFTEGMPSMAPLVNQHERLIVLQTVSKSFGLAGLRLGLCFATPELASIMNAMKAPYNISVTTSEIGKRALEPQSVELMKRYVSLVVSERARLVKEFEQIPGFGRLRGGLDANFILIEVLDKDTKQPSNERALEVYNYMATQRKIVVRFRGKEPGCLGCLRITIGTVRENDELVRELGVILSN